MSITTVASSPGSQEGGGERERRAWYIRIYCFADTAIFNHYDKF